MFPDKVDRMVLDGVLDVDAYIGGDPKPNLVDTDKAVNSFFQSCFNAGPELCAFHDSSPEAISANFDALLDQLKVNPVPVITPEGFGLVDYTLVHNLVFALIDAPYNGVFPLIAEGLSQLSAGNGTFLYKLANAGKSVCELGDPDYSDIIPLHSAVFCNDAVTLNKTAQEWQQLYEETAQVSEYADFWVPYWILCQCALPFLVTSAHLLTHPRDWLIESPNSYHGPFGAKTSPILFVSTAAG